jgi:hypothetical protein
MGPNRGTPPAPQPIWSGYAPSLQVGLQPPEQGDPVQGRWIGMGRLAIAGLLKVPQSWGWITPAGTPGTAR